MGTVTKVVASHYGKGDGFHGKTTASCTRFDKNGKTAAHKTLRLGTEVELCNPEKGVCEHATITDRGPFVQGRDIDVASVGLGAPLSVGHNTKLTMRIVSVPEKPVLGSACEGKKARAEHSS